MRWEYTGGLLLGIVALIMGVAIRLDRHGRYKSVSAQYYDHSWVWYVRNRAFGLIPAGIGFILIFISFALDNSEEPQYAALGIAVGMLGLLSWLIAVRVTYKPPDWLKPRWLREEERAGRRQKHARHG